jgi:acyl dehydratase
LKLETRYFEDLKVGDAFESESVTLSEEKIMEFARDYDPQPMHLDKAWADTGPYGGLIASGFQSAALAFKLIWDTGLMTESNIIGAGMDKLRWYKPVKAGTPLSARVEVVALRESKSKPDRGLVTWGFSLVDEAGELLVSYEDTAFLKKRSAS